MSSELRRTPLYESHVALGGKIVPFAGWEMPVLYNGEDGRGGVSDEHVAVRSAVGLFDVSHMGEIEVRGKDTIAFLEKMTCNYVSGLTDGRAQYTALTNPEGGVVDDIIIYRHAEDHFLLCVNASNADIDFAWLLEHKAGDIELINKSSDYSQLAVQGPKAFSLLSDIFGKDFNSQIKPFYFCSDTYQGSESGSEASNVLIARTGYTGEDGVEIFCHPSKAVSLWSELLEKGKQYGVLPCGLGARDSLRLEVCYPLHGHELGPSITAIESGLGWIVKPKKKGEFLGRDVLEKEKNEGASRKLVGFQVIGRGIVREECVITDQSGENEIGFVTSGTKTPTVGKTTGKAVGLALVSSQYGGIGDLLSATVRGKSVEIEVVKTPFYSKA